MEVQSECAEPPPAAATPPCDPQPPPPPTAGKINKAAFKLFGKRRSGSGMAGFFSFRNKGAYAANNNNANDNGSSSSSSVEIIRSKTHDGLVVPSGAANGGVGAAEADGAAPRSQEVGTVRSLSKSLSFFSLLRRGSLRASGGGESGGGAGLVGRRGRGLKGLFSSMRWRRKDKSVGDGETAAVAVLEARARCDENHREEAKDITLTLEPPPPHQALEDHGSTPEAEAEGRSLPGPETCRAANVAAASPPPPHRATVNELPPCDLDSSVFPYTPTDSPLHSGSAPPPLLSKTNKTSVSSYSPPPSATPPLDAAGDPPSEPSVDRLCSLLFTDVTSLKSFDSLTGCGDIIADAEEEGGGAGGNGGGGSGTSSSSSGGGGGGGVGSTGGAGERPTGATASRGSPCKPPLTSQSYTATAAAQLSATAATSLPARARVAAPPPTPLSQQQQHHPQTGSGVVAYMGGGEEMASPEGVDDADMQGLWHMLPSTGDNSPALPPRSHQTSTSSNPPVSHHHHRVAAPALRGSEWNKPPQVKALGLSKIPVVGGGGGGGGGGGRAAAKPPLPHGAQQQQGRQAAACTSPPGDKEPLSDEGYWDTPSATPTATPDEGGGVQTRSQKIALMTRDSCSGDHLYDLYNDPDEALDGGEEAEDDLACSTPSPSTEYKLSPPSVTTPPSSASSNSSFRSMKGSASLPRDSKIPISVSNKPTPPHSVSQSALSSVVEASVDAPPPKTTEASAPARTRIPVSKVPVRRSAGNASRGHRK